MTTGSLLKAEIIEEYSYYFWPALSDNQPWKRILGLFESGRFTQVLLYQLFAYYFKSSWHYTDDQWVNLYYIPKGLSRILAMICMCIISA